MVAVIPWIAIPVIPFGIAFFFLQRYFSETSRDIKRLECASEYGTLRLVWQSRLAFLYAISLARPLESCRLSSGISHQVIEYYGPCSVWPLRWQVSCSFVFQHKEVSLPCHILIPRNCLPPASQTFQIHCLSGWNPWEEQILQSLGVHHWFSKKAAS